MAHKSGKQFDIIIAGAGPAGLSFARALAKTDLQIGLIEKSPEKFWPTHLKMVAISH